jgi:hypothetical protein
VTANAAGPVFLCYRPEDTGWIAGRIRAGLEAAFGDGSVLVDVSARQRGTEGDSADGLIAMARVLVVILGRYWQEYLVPDDRHGAGTPHDRVRTQVDTAVRQKMPVVVVLNEGAEVPPALELPASLAKLFSHPPVRIDTGTIETDMERLAEAIRNKASSHRDAHIPPAREPRDSPDTTLARPATRLDAGTSGADVADPTGPARNSTRNPTPEHRRKRRDRSARSPGLREVLWSVIIVLGCTISAASVVAVAVGIYGWNRIRFEPGLAILLLAGIASFPLGYLVARAGVWRHALARMRTWAERNGWIYYSARDARALFGDKMQRYLRRYDDVGVGGATKGSHRCLTVTITAYRYTKYYLYRNAEGKVKTGSRPVPLPVYLVSLPRRHEFTSVTPESRWWRRLRLWRLRKKFADRTIGVEEFSKWYDVSGVHDLSPQLRQSIFLGDAPSDWEIHGDELVVRGRRHPSPRNVEPTLEAIARLVSLLD